MRKILLLLIALLPMIVSADDVKKHRMIVSLKSGEKVSFVVSEKPEVTFDGDKFCVKTTKSTFDYLRSDINDFYFEESGTDLETLEYVGNGLATIYDMSGHIVTTLKEDSPQAAKLLIDSFKPGMYIIKIGNQSIKYLKK